MMDIVEQGRIDTHLVYNVDSSAKSTRLVDTLMKWVIENTSSISPIAAFVKEHLDIIFKEGSFENAWEQQVTIQGRMQISPTLRAQCPKIEAPHLTPPEPSALSVPSEDVEKGVKRATVEIIAK